MRPEDFAAGSAPRGVHPAPARPPVQPRTGRFVVIRRNGGQAPFDTSKITVAMTKAFLGVEGGAGVASSRIHEIVDRLTQQVVHALTRRSPSGGVLHIEDIQDHVELALMRAGEQQVARAYVIYREQRAARRAETRGEQPAAPTPTSRITVVHDDGSRKPLDIERIEQLLTEACSDLQDVDAGQVLAAALPNLFDGITEDGVATTLVMSARGLIEKEPDYSCVAARLLLDVLRREVLSAIAGQPVCCGQEEMAGRYPDYFAHYVQQAIAHQLLDPALADFDLAALGRALCPERDLQFTYLGLQTLYDRYFVHHGGVRIELPQAFFMRVAMGLALQEKEDRERHAREFYDLLSSFDFMSSTPTLFNAGTPRPQLSSCYLTTVPDDLDGIFSAIRDDALLSKYAGGLGNDWTQVRALGAHIRGTNGKSQGVVPFLKVANDTAVAVNQGGKRKGAMCAYLETWHLDIEEFLELRKNTGDDRRRTHDMNTANWIPDLFMRRVAGEQDWTLFSPHETADLHDLYGPAFDARYQEYERRVQAGEGLQHKVVSAVELWRKMLSMLFETGHPWLTFKDPCNLRSPQAHVGVVHSSNLCTEITLNTSDSEIAVCNLGSVNLARHVDENGLQLDKLQRTADIAMRMLDNVIDYNYYAVPAARESNLRHRPLGLGIMGFQDALYALRIPYASEEAVAFADRSMEAISYFAIQASTLLAEERGAYPSFEGSLWSQGVLPIDSIQRLAQARGDQYLQLDDNQSMDWRTLRERVRTVGMRNSNCLAIAPTATISNICGVTQSIEPTYQNLYVKSNLSGEFTMTNPWLVRDLKAAGLWDEVMINDLKYFDGSVQAIDRVPEEIKSLYATAFELDPCWLVEAGARRQKWIDQSQSLNLYMAEASGRKLDALYRLAWLRGLKTTYYLRSLGATHMEKGNEEQVGATDDAAVCSLLDEDCEVCQ